MTYVYSLYGLTVESDRAIPGIPASADETAIDLYLHFAQAAPDHLLALGEAGWQPHPLFELGSTLTHAGTPAILTDPDQGWLRFVYAEGTTFTLSLDGRIIYIDPNVSVASEVIYTWLLNQIMVFCLRLRGHICLHASAAAVEDGAVLFVAPSGSGKSTLAYEFARRGYPFITDDVCALLDLPDGRVGSTPAHPYLRLWGESLAAVDEDSADLARIVTPKGKRLIDIGDARFQLAERPLPVRLVCLLDGYGDALTLTPLPPPRALMRLMGNTYLTFLYAPEQRAGDFRWLTRLTAQAKVVSLVRPHDITRLGESADALLALLQQAMPSPVSLSSRSG